MWNFGAAFVILFVHVIVQVSGHVSLTFPPARKYDLDFLDTFRTPKPCGGMPKGEIKTTIQSNRDLEITWHMGHPHQGGFKIELLDSNGQLIQDLTPAGLYEGANKIETQSYTVSLGGLTCDDCTIRLVRQALEWGNKYQFHSCADVSIVGTPVQDCSGHGSYRGGRCQCQRTYSGDRCQYKNDCETDDDCGRNNGNGRCIDIKSTVLPTKQCYCKGGFFGLNCDKFNANLTSADFIPGRYTKVEGHGVDFYWRRVNDGREIEGVIDGKQTTSYVGVGWRPKDLTKACQSLPGVEHIGKDFHAMDCTDIVIGTVRDGSLSRVLDYYTRDRSTPRYDSVYGGEDDITGAVGSERDGRTVIIFRKRTISSDKTDHSFIGDLHYIWAHGRDDLAFFGDDELKYHGPRNKASKKIATGSAGKLSAKGTLPAVLVFVLASFFSL